MTLRDEELGPLDERIADSIVDSTFPRVREALVAARGEVEITYFIWRRSNSLRAHFDSNLNGEVLTKICALVSFGGLSVISVMAEPSAGSAIESLLVGPGATEIASTLAEVSAGAEETDPEPLVYLITAAEPGLIGWLVKAPSSSLLWPSRPSRLGLSGTFAMTLAEVEERIRATRER